MRVLVCGGRDYENREVVFRVLDEVQPEVVIHGAAKGADTLAGAWARSRGVPEIPCPADWARHGRSAGPRRNREMLERHSPDLVVAFPGGRGTENMMMQARAAGVSVAQYG